MNPMSHFRFRLWHIFLLVAIAAVAMWLVTQVGMVTAEIEIVQFDTWPRTKRFENDTLIEVINVKFKYVQPVELSNMSLNLFYGDPALAESKNIEVGGRIKFRYRAKPMLWLKPTKPDPIAIRSLAAAIWANTSRRADGGLGRCVWHLAAGIPIDGAAPRSRLGNLTEKTSVCGAQVKRRRRQSGFGPQYSFIALRAGLVRPCVALR